MSLSISFKPGQRQSFAAARYFNGAAEEALHESIIQLKPRQYHLELPLGRSMRLRIWSAEQFDEDRAGRVLQWLQGLHQDIDTLSDRAQRDELLGDIIRGWSAANHDGLTFLLEHWGDAPSAKEDPLLTVGVLGGRMVMLSTDALMFAQLHDGLCGLSLARYGSYLIEIDGDERRRLKRA